MMLTKRRCGLVAVAGALGFAVLGAGMGQAAPLSGTNLNAVAGTEPYAQSVHWRGRYYRPYYYSYGGYYEPRYYRRYRYRPHSYYGYYDYAPRHYYYPRPRYHHYRYW